MQNNVRVYNAIWLLQLTGNFTSYSWNQLTEIDFGAQLEWATEFRGSPAIYRRIQKAYDRARILMGVKTRKEVDINKFMTALNIYLTNSARSEQMNENDKYIGATPLVYYYAVHSMVMGIC